MSPQLLTNKHYRLRDSRLSLVRLSGGLRLVAEKTTQKNKPRVDYEPRSAHGRAVNISFRKHSDEEKENNLLTLIIKM